MNYATIKKYGTLALWIFLPIIWGIVTWFMLYSGPLRLLTLTTFAPNQLSWFLQVIFFTIVIAKFLGASLNYAANNYTPTVFGYSIWLPSWNRIIFFVFIGIGITLFFNPIDNYPGLHSFLTGVLVSASMEELVTHGFFVRYKFTKVSFVWFNCLSAISFLFMHLGYCQTINIMNLIHPINMPIVLVARISFPLLFGLITYRTKRIEPAILLHMVVNLIYTITTYMLCVPSSYQLVLIIGQLILISIVVLGSGCLQKVTIDA